MIALVVCLMSIVSFCSYRDYNSWEAQIKRHQDPEELRKWALQVVADHNAHVYPVDKEKEIAETSLPSSLPRSGRFPYLVIAEDHVRLIWHGLMDTWLLVGAKDFESPYDKKWEPGIYFHFHPN